MKSVEVKCRKCGRLAEADKFVLDHTYKMMVCPACVRERKTKEVHSEMKAEQAKQKEEVPVISKEDKEIEKAYMEKQAGKVFVEKIDDEKVKYRCPSCNYEFTYNIVKLTPGRCPYCGAPIANLKI